MPDIEEMKNYVETVTKKVAKKKLKGLNSAERRLGAKLHEVQEKAQAVNEDMNRLREGMQQAQQRLDGMIRHHLELSSKAGGFIESLIALKFGDEIDKEKAEKEKKETGPKGNGAQDPSKPAPKRKKRVGRVKTKSSQPAI